MLWARALQWDWAMHNGLQLVPKQRFVRVLGCIPSLREGQQNHCAANPDRVQQVHEPNESQYYFGLGL